MPFSALRCVLTLSLALLALTPAVVLAEDYALVVSRSTAADPAWAKVVQALQAKHNGATIAVAKLEDCLPRLAQTMPRYTCFVARPEEATREFVAQVHQLTRRLDDDPYTDTIWGILTGYDAANALKIAETRDPLVVRRVGSGTEVALDRCVEGAWYCELKQHRLVRKASGGKPQEERGPADTTQALADLLTKYRADLFVTSGHATERNWQIGYRYENGYFVSKAGQLYGRDTRGREFPIASDNPKVYLPIGNCLMGHIDGADAMALAFMNSAGVRQMVGYTVLTWYGYGGWGCLDYFVEQPGRYTFAEAFFANHQALLHKLDDAPSAADRRGLSYDRDVVAFYGDPAWECRLAPGPLAYQQKLEQQQGLFTFTILPQAGEKSFEPVNTNGAQRGWRPIFAFLPRRVGPVEIVEGADLKPVITDNFILVPNPRQCDPSRAYRIVFRERG